MSLMLMLISVACGFGRVPPEASGVGPPLVQIEREAAFALIMPGARESGSHKADRFSSIDGQTAAYSLIDFDSSATAADVYAYYDIQLKANGWKPSRVSGLSFLESDGRAWCKPQMYFTVTIADLPALGRRGLPTPAPGQIRFTAGITGMDVRCPD